MKRFHSASLSICALFGLISLAVACGSGDEDPATAGSSGSGNTSAGTGNTTGGTGAGTGGSTSTTGGTGTTTGGTGTTTGGATSTGGTTSTATSVCDGSTRVLPEAEAFVDDFEDDTRFGGWYAFADDGSPEPHEPPLHAVESGGAATTASGLHVSASNIKTPTAGGYGAGFGFNMIDPTLEKCVDVAAFDGISFWIKGTSGSDDMVTFQIVHPATAPVADGGDCAVMAQCYLHPKKAIAVTGEWTQHTIAWSDLGGSSATVTGPILGFNVITAGTEYDVWLDEVTLYKGTAPTGPVGTEDGAGGSGG